MLIDFRRRQMLPPLSLIFAAATTFSPAPFRHLRCRYAAERAMLRALAMRGDERAMRDASRRAAAIAAAYAADRRDVYAANFAGALRADAPALLQMSDAAMLAARHSPILLLSLIIFFHDAIILSPAAASFFARRHHFAACSTAALAAAASTTLLKTKYFSKMPPPSQLRRYAERRR